MPRCGKIAYQPGIKKFILHTITILYFNHSYCQNCGSYRPWFGRIYWQDAFRHVVHQARWKLSENLSKATDTTKLNNQNNRPWPINAPNTPQHFSFSSWRKCRLGRALELRHVRIKSCPIRQVTFKSSWNWLKQRQENKEPFPLLLVSVSGVEKWLSDVDVPFIQRYVNYGPSRKQILATCCTNPKATRFSTPGLLKNVLPTSFCCFYIVSHALLAANFAYSL